MNSIPAPDQPLDPRAALASITAAETSTRKSIGPNVAVLYFVWAAAYLLGYGLLQVPPPDGFHCPSPRHSSSGR